MHNLAAEHPEKVRELVALWFAEAGANGAFPLDDRSRAGDHPDTERPVLSPPRNRYVYFPDCAEVPESQAVNLRNRSFSIGALVDISESGGNGVLIAQGSRFGGYSLYIEGNRLHYINNFVGVLEQKVVSTVDVPTGKNLVLSASFEKTGQAAPGVGEGTLSLWHGDTKVGEGTIKVQPGPFMLAGEGLCVGRDGGHPVTDYVGDQPWRFTGGRIHRVAVDVSGEPYVDLLREAETRLAHQ